MTATTAVRSILICDDQEDILDYVSYVLSGAGYNVSTSRGYAEFIEKFTASRPDLIVLDIRLPDHDGFWIAELLKTMECKAPVIFLTAHDGPLYRLYAPIAGAIDFLTKPIEPEVLLERIEKALATDPKSSNWFLQATAYEKEDGKP